jgi:hypothetical protein
MKKKQFQFGGRRYEISFKNEKKGPINIGSESWFVPSIDYLKEKKQVLIIGAGWYGCHTALALKKAHPAWDIYLFEKKANIFSAISGLFGIRLHTGPHYPRSKVTREACHQGFINFRKDYPELINDHSYSIYGLGNKDAAGRPSKVTVDEFSAVCQEFGNAREIQPKEWNYQNLLYAVDIDEPSVIVGKPLRGFFAKKLKEADVKVYTNTNVTHLEKQGNKIAVKYSKKYDYRKHEKSFDQVINTTSYQSLIPSPPPLGINVVYQVCLALDYKHKVDPLPEKPFSFIGMDGGFPSFMPCANHADRSKPVAKYILTNGEYTQHSFNTANEAHAFLAQLKNTRDTYVSTEVRKKCEAEMQRFYPNFLNEFKYKAWRGTVLCKLVTDTEVRCAVTYKDEKGVITVTPGKISEISATAKEVEALILNSNESIVKEGQYSYIEAGVFARARKEFATKPKENSVKTSDLKSFSNYSAEVYQKPSFWQQSLSFLQDACFEPLKAIERTRLYAGVN